MSSKFGLILSMLFVSLFFGLGVDMISIQIIYSDLDAKSVAISYRISEYGTIDDSLVQSIQNDFNVTFTCQSNCQPLFGDTVTYIISRMYKPLVVQKEQMTVNVQRTAVIGYYN